MNQSSKNSSEVITFMGLFAKLKGLCDEEPGHLRELVRNDSKVFDLCKKLNKAAQQLKSSERQERVLITAPVNPAFIELWREYEARYDETVSDAYWYEIFYEVIEALKDINISDSAQSSSCDNPSKLDLLWEEADENARDKVKHLEAMIDFAADHDDDEDFSDGLDIWSSLGKFGYDPHGFFRRRELTPFFLVPTDVANKDKNNPTSMLTGLQRAQEAFIFGSTHAALALMRSVMESVLRDHYKCNGKDLSECIKSVKDSLPPGANQAALHRLRMSANKVVHPDKDATRLEDDKKLEKEVVSLLYVLRALIEGVKKLP